MKFIQLILFCLLAHQTIQAQIFKKDDVVEIDRTLNDTVEGSWQLATVVMYDSIVHHYHLKTSDGTKVEIPSTTPERWIRPVVNKMTVNKYGPGAKFPYVKRANAIRPIKCNGSEASVKRNITTQMATQFADYPYIYVEFTSFKGQHGYQDKQYAGQQVYPYKIEMLVHLRRSLVFAGRQYTEYQTWEYDREYEYFTRPGRNCEFKAVPSSDAKLISKGWY